MDFIVRIQLENGKEKMQLCEHHLDAAIAAQQFSSENNSPISNCWLYRYYQTLKSSGE